jgi:twitching motility protein PilT
MGSFERWVGLAQAAGASDLQLESGQAAWIRVDGALRPLDGGPGGALPQRGELVQAVESLLSASEAEELQSRRSVDLSRVMAGVRCRFNIFYTSRGLSASIRLLANFQVTIESLNLHPDVGRLLQRQTGLVLVCGPTGSGKSSTMAAMVEEINRNRAVHVVALEAPIEYHFRPRRALIRQREVGRDTPTFHQGLMDALREDPDVILVGEVRDAETIRLALLAAETGHLVITSIHAGSCAEALTRVVSSFPAEGQAAVQAALAESLVGVLCQRLVWRPEPGIRAPECELLINTDPIRGAIRGNTLHRLGNVIQTNAVDGMWSFERWRRWQDTRDRWFVRSRDAQREPLPEEGGGAEISPPSLASRRELPSRERSLQDSQGATAGPPGGRAPIPTRGLTQTASPSVGLARRGAKAGARVGDDGVLELDDAAEDLHTILRELK